MIFIMHNLVSETLRLAKASKIPAADICAAADIKLRWYYRFLAGDFKEPGANKITRLYQALTVQKRTAA